MIDWPKGPTRWREGETLCISVPFTWNLLEIEEELEQRDFWDRKVVLGGPAFKLMPDYLPEMDNVEIREHSEGVLQRINPMATRTTTGCPNSCGFCAVPITEGKMVELNDWPDLPIICDNNLLDASASHFDKVCDRLEAHKWCDFNQGLDARLLNDHHAERLSRLRGAIVRLALDHSGMTDDWMIAFERLRSAGFPKSRIRSYILTAYKSDVDDAWARCEFVQNLGVNALPQWFHPLKALERNAVLPCHIKYGWNDYERKHIMGYYYKHRGQVHIKTVKRKAEK